MDFRFKIKEFQPLNSFLDFFSFGLNLVVCLESGILDFQEILTFTSGQNN